MELSVVTTLYYSASFIEEFYKRISKTASEITSSYEIIFVNDGSPDTVLNKVLEIFKKDKRVVVINLSKNFGHHKAILTGLAYARGAYVFLTDCDLEEDPELLSIFWKKINKQFDIDVVYGVQKERQGNFWRRKIENLFYKFFNFFSDVKLTKNLVMTRIMTKNFVKAIVSYSETYPVFAALSASAGFNQKTLPIIRTCRNKSSYTLFHKLAIIINSITSFSEKPLIFISILGFVMMFFSSILIIWVFIQRILNSKLLGGWMSLIISVWFLGGLIIFCIGIIGIYLAKIFIQVKNRPFTIIKKIYRSNYAKSKSNYQ